MEHNNHTELLQKAGEALDDVLKAGRIYYQEKIKTKYGSQGGSIYFVENGVTYDYRNQDDTMREEMDAIDTKLDSLAHDMNPDVLFRAQAPFTKVQFIFQKGKPVVFKALHVTELLDNLKKHILHDNQTRIKEGDEFEYMESLIRFVSQAGELGMFIDTTFKTKNSMRSSAHLSDDSALECLYAALGKNIQSLYLKLENGTLTAQSEPAFPEWNLSELKIKGIELEEAYRKSKTDFEEAQKLRHEHYNSFGKMDERPIYLNIGGFRSINWPENSHSHISEIMRVIYTSDSTVLITDGMSDVYLGRKDHEQYNGTGLEFYIEFDGHVPFETVKDHFCLALMNSVSQIALNHGDFKKLMENYTYTTIEFNEGNVELWVVKNNNSNQDIKTFFEDKQYKGDKFGTLLGMESARIPKSMTLNKEGVLLVNIKPFGQEWLKPAKLKNKSEDVQAKTRLAMMETFRKAGEANKIPVSYNTSGKSNNPEKSDIVKTPLFPM
jgi:hypothetical protein